MGEGELKLESFLIAEVIRQAVRHKDSSNLPPELTADLREVLTDTTIFDRELLQQLKVTYLYSAEGVTIDNSKWWEETVAREYNVEKHKSANRYIARFGVLDFYARALEADIIDFNRLLGRFEVSND